MRMADLIERAQPASRGPSASHLVRTLQAVIVAAIILPAAVFAAIATMEWRDVHSAAELRAQRTAAILREHALKVFETHELILDRVDDRTRNLSWQEIEQSVELTDFMKGIVETYSHVSSLLLVKPDGYLSNNSRRFPLAPPVRVADRDYFRIPAESVNAGTVIDEPVSGRVSGEPIINISRRRESSSGEFTGVVAIALFLDYFATFYRAHNPAGDSSVRLVRADGTVLVSQPPPTTGVQKLSTASGLMSSINVGSTRTYTSVSELDGIRRLFAFEKIGRYPVYVSYGVNLASVQHQWLASIVYYGLFASFAMIGLALMGWVALRHARAEWPAAGSVDAQLS